MADQEQEHGEYDYEAYDGEELEQLFASIEGKFNENGWLADEGAGATSGKNGRAYDNLADLFEARLGEAAPLPEWMEDPTYLEIEAFLAEIERNATFTAPIRAGKRTRECIATLIYALKQGMVLSDAADFAGIAPGSVTHWHQLGERHLAEHKWSFEAALHLAVQRAKATFSHDALRAVRRCANNLDSRAAIWLASLNPNYRPQSKVDIRVTREYVAKLSDDQLEALAAGRPLAMLTPPETIDVESRRQQNE